MHKLLGRVRSSGWWQRSIHAVNFGSKAQFTTVMELPWVLRSLRSLAQRLMEHVMKLGHAINNSSPYDGLPNFKFLP